MVTADGVLFLVYFLIFIVASFLAFFIPGDLLMGRLRLSLLPRLVGAIGLGIVAWGWQGMIFGYLGLRQLTYGYLAICLIVWLAINRRALSPLSWKNISKPKPDWVLGGILTLGILIQLSAVWFLGKVYRDGLFFCCRGVPDDIFHIALTDELVKRFPPFEPGMFGVVVHNYHYWANLVMADLIRVFALPLIPTVYQYFPVLISLLLGLAVIVLAKTLAVGKNFSRWLAFFVFFHGDVLYLLTLLRGKGLNLDVTILDDASKLLAGPTRSFSVALLFVGLILFINWIKDKRFGLGILAAFLFGSLVGFKVYTGIFALVGLAAAALYPPSQKTSDVSPRMKAKNFLLRRDFAPDEAAGRRYPDRQVGGLHFLLKRNGKMLILLILAGILTLIIYLPVNSRAGGLNFNGLYRFENFIVQPAFGLQNLELARLAFLADHKYGPVAGLETLFFGAYVLFLFGPALVGLVQNKKSLSVFPAELNVFLISASAVTAIVGFFFAQTVGGANTVQFLLTLYFILAIYAALACSYWFEKMPKSFRWLAAGVIVVVTATRVIHEGGQNVQMVVNRQGLLVSNEELAAENWLRTKTPENSLVMLGPDWALSENFLRVSFLTQRPIFFAGYIGVLKDHQAAGATVRKAANETVFTSDDKWQVEKQLTENHINYLFFPAGKSPAVGNLRGRLQLVMRAGNFFIWKFAPELSGLGQRG